MQIDRADFRDLMTFLSFNLLEEISLNPEAISSNTWSLDQPGLAERTKLIKANWTA